MKSRGKWYRLVLCLLMAALVSSLAFTGTLAKYTSGIASGGVVNVASFVGDTSVQFTLDLGSVSPVQEQPSTSIFKVCNYDDEQRSEVDLEYELRVETTGNLPLVFSLRGQTQPGDTAAATGASKLVGALTRDPEDGYVWTASGGKLPAAADDSGKKEHTYELSVRWADGENSEDYSHEIDMVTVTVTTVQARPVKTEPAGE